MSKEIKLELVKEGDFLGTKCDFYKDENNSIYMTREQIGEALQYSDPIRNISKLHSRNNDRLDKFSVVVDLTTTDGKQYNTTLYIERGIYDITRFSRQPVADDFYDWVYEQVETLRRTSGVITLGEEIDFLDNYFPALTEDTKLMLVKDLNENIKKQQEKIKELQPKADDWSAYMDKDGYITISKLSKTLNIEGLGRNNMFGLLRRNEILRSNNEPYQRYVNEGYFKTVVGTKNGFPFTQTLVSAKGMSYLNKKLKEWGYVSP